MEMATVSGASDLPARLIRSLTEGTPSLRDVAKVAASLAEHEWRVREGLVYLEPR